MASSIPLVLPTWANPEVLRREFDPFSGRDEVKEYAHNGYVYGWSESNIQYELLGKLTQESDTDIDINPESDTDIDINPELGIHSGKRNTEEPK